MLLASCGTSLTPSKAPATSSPADPDPVPYPLRKVVWLIIVLWWVVKGEGRHQIFGQSIFKYIRTGIANLIACVCSKRPVIRNHYTANALLLRG